MESFTVVHHIIHTIHDVETKEEAIRISRSLLDDEYWFGADSQSSVVRLNGED